MSDVAGLLQELLSRRLTAYIAGVNDGKTVTREVTKIRKHETEQRLRAAYEIAQLLLGYDSPQTVRAWFIGLNPQLGDESPAEAIQAGRLKETFTAARAFIAEGPRSR